jgi:hypothetical protein
LVKNKLALSREERPVTHETAAAAAGYIASCLVHQFSMYRVNIWVGYGYYSRNVWRLWLIGTVVQRKESNR